jgi:hypothetical protein
MLCLRGIGRVPNVLCGRRLLPPLWRWSLEGGREAGRRGSVSRPGCLFVAGSPDGEAGRYSEPFTQPNDHTDPSPRDALDGETQTGVSVYQYIRSDERWEEVARPPV